MEIKVLASSSKGNAILVKYEGMNLLLDCGLPAKEIRKKSGFCKIDFVLLTHCHKDHSKAAADLLKQGVDIYTSKGTVESCGLSGNRLYEIQKLTEFYIGNIKIIPFDTKHDAKEPLGFYIEFLANDGRSTGEKLLYAIDTYYIEYRFTGITHLLIECNYCEEILERNVQNGSVDPAVAERIRCSHFSLDNLLKFLEAGKEENPLKQIYLLHLSDGNSDEQKMKSEVIRKIGCEVYV